MAPTTMMRMRKPIRIVSGMPTKNTCICGISFARMPSPMLNRSPNTRNGAAICTPMRKAPATVVRQRVGDVAEHRHLAGPEDDVAVVERRDHQMMQVGRKDHGEAEHCEEIADEHALLSLGRIDRGDEAEPHLLGDHHAGNLQRRDREPRQQAQHRADQQLLEQQLHHRHEGVQIDLIGAAVQRHDDRGEHQRKREPHPRRHRELAQPRQQHDHRADAREAQHEGCGNRPAERRRRSSFR